MKTKTQFSVIGSILVAFALAHVTALGQGAPTPGPEHEHLKKLEGTWNAKIKMGDTESPATATYKMVCGGMWLMSDFQGQFGDQKFSGQGLDGYDPEKKKYVSVWVDSMSSRPMLLERPHKLQKRCRFIVKLSVKPADPREAALRQRQFAFGDSTLHAAPATSTTCTSFVVDSRPP